MIKAVIFDLDGTLLDTLADLADSLNYALNACGFPLRTIAEVKSYVGSGAMVLVDKAVPTNTSASVQLRCHNIFLDYYLDHLADKCAPYDGICDMLAAIKQEKLMLAVVSNKPHLATLKLVNQFFPNVFNFVTGKLDGVEKKPDKAAMLLALSALGIAPAEAIYVGDSDVDILFAKNSKVPCISVDWGFREREKLIEAGAEIVISLPSEVPQIAKNFANN